MKMDKDRPMDKKECTQTERPMDNQTDKDNLVCGCVFQPANKWILVVYFKQQMGTLHTIRWLK